jgi:flagellar hook-basal body complex protein FliE
MSADMVRLFVPREISPIRPIDHIGTGSLSAPGGTQVPFADVLGQAMRDVVETQKSTAQDAYDLVMGTGDDLHNIMIRNAMETAAVETAVELTSRVVSVYKEIMQMQI